MKKNFKVILSIALLMTLLIACSSNDENEPNDENNTAVTNEDTNDNIENNKTEDNNKRNSSKNEKVNSDVAEDQSDSKPKENDEDEKHEYTCSELEDMTTKQKADLPQDVKHKYGLSDDGEMYTECTSSKEQSEFNRKIKQLEDKGIGKEERQIATIWLQEIGRKDVDVLRVADMHEGTPVIWPDKEKSATYKEPVKQLSSKGVEYGQVIFSINKGETTYNFYKNYNPSDKPDDMNTYEYTKEIVENPETKEIFPGSEFDGFDVLEMAEKIEYVGPVG